MDLCRGLLHVSLSSQPDTIQWCWADSDVYSASSCYKALFHGFISFEWRLAWKTRVPLSVQFFIWLASMNRSWPTNCLARRGLPHEPACILCSQESETLHHIFVCCVFAHVTWQEVLSWCRPAIPAADGSSSFFNWISMAMLATPVPLRPGLTTVVVLTAWSLWCRRNVVIFDKIVPSTSCLVATVKDEARS